MRTLTPGQFLRVLVDTTVLDNELVTCLPAGERVKYIKPSTLRCELSCGELVDIRTEVLDLIEE